MLVPEKEFAMNLSVGILLGGFAAGLAVGLFYFGALWWTVKRLPDSRNPGLLALASYVFRLAVVLTVFYVVMGGRWQNLVACGTGFILARTFLVRRLQPVE